MSAPVTEALPPTGTPPVGRRARRMGPWRRGVREVGLALITLGVILLLFVAYELWGTGLYESHKQASLEKSFNTTVSANADNPAVGAALPSAPPGGAIDHLRIPRIGLDKYVVQGVSENDLREGPGHYPETVMPGQDGNAAIAGHRTTYGAPFFELNEMAVGDPIYITNLKGQTFLYKVSKPPQVVSPDNVSVLGNTPFPQLTLTTCNPRFSATSRLIVFARLVGRPVPGITRVSTAGPVTLTGTLGGGDHGAWPAAIAYGALVVALWAGVRLLINRTRRWARAGVYVGGIALCLIPLWFMFENVVLLLPQSI